MTHPKPPTLSKKVLLSLVGILGSLILGTAAVRAKTELVTGVVDGDTFFIQNNQPIRLYGLDAPEMGNCFSQEAKDTLTAAILGKRVQLREPLSDRTGRVMALVYQDNRLINELMIKNGYALATGVSGAESAKMNQANTYAREHKLGIYSRECYQIEPPNKNCTIKGNIESRSDKKTYLRPDCINYDEVVVQKYLGESWFCSEKEALAAGFVKSGNCH